MCVCLNRFQSISGNIHHETESLSIFQSAHKHKLRCIASERARERTSGRAYERISVVFIRHIFIMNGNLWMLIYHMHGMCCNQSESRVSYITKIIHRERAHRQNCIKRHPIGRDLKIPMLMCTILLNHKGRERFHANNFYFNSIGYQAANGNRIQKTASTKIARVIILGPDFFFFTFNFERSNESL